MKSLKIIRRAINNNPLTKNNKLAAWRRFVKWQIISRVYPNGIVVPYVEGSKLLVKKSMHGATGSIYLGLQEFEDMIFMLHFLKPDDTFMDIGANIGSYTILAGAVSKAKVICFEPIPQTYKSLLLNIQLNQLEDHVKAINKGLGEKNDRLKFTNSFDTVNHVITENGTADFVEVEVITLNDFMKNGNVDIPSIIKIDVEGFEMSVLNGAENLLQNNALKVLIVEINGCCNAFEVKEIEIHDKIISFGFKAYNYSPFLRQLQIQSSYTANGNTLYIRDETFVLNRVANAPKIKILNKDV